MNWKDDTNADGWKGSALILVLLAVLVWVLWE